MWDRPWKNHYRIVAMDSKLRAVKVALFFPGIDCLCVIAALNAGIITRKTKLIIVEKVPATANAIRRKLSKLGLYNVVLYAKECGSVDLSWTETSPIEFAFYDLCGQMTPKVIRFLQTCHFAKNAECSFTTSNAFRNNHIVAQVAKFDTSGARSNIHNQLTSPFCRATYPVGKDQGPLYLTLLLLKIALHGWNNQIVECHEYNDGRTPMLFTKLYVKRVKKTESIFTRAARKLGLYLEPSQLNDILEWASTIVGRPVSIPDLSPAQLARLYKLRDKFSNLYSPQGQGRTQ